MPVFDFSAAPEDSRQPECTYTTFQSNEETATPEKPIMILDNTKRQWQHHVMRYVYESGEADVL